MRLPPLPFESPEAPTVTIRDHGPGYTLTTPHGTVRHRRPGFGRHVCRVRDGARFLAENGIFKRRWNG